MTSSFRKNSRLGAANIPFTRWLPPQYQDGFSLPIGWDPKVKKNNHLLPLVNNKPFTYSDIFGVELRVFPFFLLGLLFDQDPRLSPSFDKVRKVSNQILSAANDNLISDPLYTHLVTIFGQWTDHDLTFTPHIPVIRSFNDGIDCSETCDMKEPCFPIVVGNSSITRGTRGGFHPRSTSFT